MRWPPLPTKMTGPAGPIRVRMIKRVTVEGKESWGCWDQSKRLITIERGAPPQHRWRVLYHEWMHAAMDDSGLSQLLTEDAAEAFCEAVASARMAEMLEQIL